MSVQLAAVIGAGGTISSLAGAFSGAFAESREMVAALTGAVLGTAVAASITIFYETMRERKNRAQDLTQDYNAPEFITIRNEAGVEFRRIKAANLNMGWNDLHAHLQPDEWRKISKILHFYKRLNFLTGLNEINKRYLSAYFSVEIWHWYNRYFKDIDAASDVKEADFRSLFSVIEKPA